MNDTPRRDPMSRMYRWTYALPECVYLTPVGPRTYRDTTIDVVAPTRAAADIELERIAGNGAKHARFVHAQAETTPVPEVLSYADDPEIARAIAELRAIDPGVLHRLTQAHDLAAVGMPDDQLAIAIKIRAAGRVTREDLAAMQRAGIELAL